MESKSPSEAALALLKAFEQGPDGGFASVIYRCPAGHKTIGWGHRVRPGERFQEPISAVEAERLLQADVRGVGEYIGEIIRVPLTQSMVDALTSFVFNVGPGAFADSTMAALLNARRYLAAGDEFLRWNKARNPKNGRKEPLSGLTRRRQAERELFLRESSPT